MDAGRYTLRIQWNTQAVIKQNCTFALDFFLDFAMEALSNAQGSYFCFRLQALASFT